MEFELREQSQNAGIKAIKIILLNIALWTATFIGYHYIPEWLNSDSRSMGKLVAIVVMGPAIALVVSIQIGIRQQRIFTASEKGIKFGDPVSGFSHYLWEEIESFDLSPDTQLLKLSLKNTDKTDSIPLRNYGINQQQFDRLLQLFALNASR